MHNLDFVTRPPRHATDSDQRTILYNSASLDGPDALQQLPASRPTHDKPAWSIPSPASGERFFQRREVSDTTTGSSRVAYSLSPPASVAQAFSRGPLENVLLNSNAHRLNDRVLDSGFIKSDSYFAPRRLHPQTPRQSSMDHSPYEPPSDPFHGTNSTATIDTDVANEPADPSGTSYLTLNAPRSRNTRPTPPVSHRHPSQTQQQQHAHTSNPPTTYYSSHQQHQQPHHPYLGQQPSPTVYYPPFHPVSHPHMQQNTPSGAFNVNQGYLGPQTTTGSSIPTYAYSHPYPHLSEHPMHGYAYSPLNGLTPAPLSHYPEADAHGTSAQPSQHTAQSAHAHGPGGVEMISAYAPIIVSSAPYGYSIPAFAPTGGPIFTPQYASPSAYHQPYSMGFSQSHPGPRPPPLNLSQRQVHPPQVSPSPMPYSPANQTPPNHPYSPIVTSPTPASLLSPGGNRGSNIASLSPFGLGSNQGGNALSDRPRGGGSQSASGYGSSGANSSDPYLGSGQGSSNSIPRMPGGDGPSLPSTAFGVERQPLTSAPTLQIPASARQNQPDGVNVRESANVTNKGERSEWVMWVGNVPGDATSDELETFFGQSPPVAVEGNREGSDTSTRTLHPAARQSPVSTAQQPSSEDKEAEMKSPETARPKSNDIVSVFLISRSNCAFINYASEESLKQAVEWFNGKPLRSPQVDPRCPKLVCRVRKKGDDLKAGVGGQRGMGIHAKWVKENVPRKRSGSSRAESGDEAMERPPLHRGGPAVSKKSSSGSSVSHASTTSSLLASHFPVRYFILKSLTQVGLLVPLSQNSTTQVIFFQYDLDLSVQRGLWATQAHNQEILDQAYRTSNTVYLIFGVNKSGEFFGYARMDGPISQVERNPAVEWASREPPATGGPKTSPVLRRSLAAEPTIEEEGESASSEARSKSEHEVESHQATANLPDEPLDSTSQPKTPPRHARSAPATVKEENDVGESHPGDREPKQQPNSEPLNKNAQGDSPQQTVAKTPVSAPSAHPISNRSMVHLLSGEVLQDSPDPLTPGEDRKLHPLERAGAAASPTQQCPGGESGDQDQLRHLSAASAPAVMERREKGFSMSVPSTQADTWDTARTKPIWSAGAIQEEAEPRPVVASTPVSPPGRMADSDFSPTHLDNLPLPESSPKPIDQVKPDEDTNRPTIGGREEGWGTPFKVKWIRTDSLPFTRTRHLRNPWNHDREVKVSRDGTEIEPSVGQRLLEEWDRPDRSPVLSRGAVQPKGPPPPTSQVSPTQPSSSRGRGRGRGFPPPSAWPHRDYGQ
ncbi:hypothetical protein PIIN_02875 [Serendipita indica DSM 11827]|uniref:YTH domain-containing protein n=1 Tax=Serendipita indica (strain DSM 11827) TaxID=1109443 RepID=G4TCH3_SERID|nr:hypothetical protein PIIN_02875 [Serendipita indica DSM 11827]